MSICTLVEHTLLVLPQRVLRGVGILAVDHHRVVDTRSAGFDHWLLLSTLPIHPLGVGDLFGIERGLEDVVVIILEALRISLEGI